MTTPSIQTSQTSTASTTPTSGPSSRKREVEDKLKRLREAMVDQRLSSVRLRGVEWFSWLTAGGSSVVILTSEAGIAEILVTADGAWILTNRIEASRLRDEELTDAIALQEFPWANAGALEDFVKRTTSGRTASDRPSGGEVPLPRKIVNLRLTLMPSEIERYRALGRSAAEAMREALARAQPDWTEYRLAGAGAEELWARGIHPTLVLVAGERRLPLYRHPLPTSDPVGGRAMMVFCGRRHGLYANITRFVYFRDPTADERRLHDQVAQVEAAALARSRPGVSTAAVLEEITRAYASIGRPDEILNHHQGGPTGYLSREEVAVPERLRPDPIELRENMAVAWNPSLPGAKIEDTVIVGSDDVEILTVDPRWPVANVAGRKRPDVWVRK